MKALVLLALVACHRDAAPPPPATIRCAVIGGMLETGFWNELKTRYERLTGNHVELVASGPKTVVVDAYRKGGIDLVTFHASDAFVNLVADGLAVDAQPWVRNDLVIVGPSDDPAHVRGMTDAVAAVKQIVAAKAAFVIHASMGADGVLHDLGVAVPPAQTILFDGDNQHAILDSAAQHHAYTLVGRIPFIDGKLKRDGIELMVRGDPKLRRPYLVATSPTAPAAAREFAAWLRSADTQAFIKTFGIGKYDAEPLFYPVETR